MPWVSDTGDESLPAFWKVLVLLGFLGGCVLGMTWFQGHLVFETGVLGVFFVYFLRMGFLLFGGD